MTADLKEKSDLIKELEERCNQQEDQSRRNNLQFDGVEELQDETWEQTATHISKLLEDKLQLPNIEMERAHRVGQRLDQRPRPIIAKFSRFCHREAVLRNSAKLRATRIYVNEDLCPASQKIRKDKPPLLKQARSDGKIPYFRHTKLIIKEKPDVHIGSGWSRVGTVPGVGAGGGGGVSGDAETPVRPQTSSGAAALAFAGSDPSVSASVAGGGIAGLTPDRGSRAAAVKAAIPQPTTPTQEARRKTRPRK